VKHAMQAREDAIFLKMAKAANPKKTYHRMGLGFSNARERPVRLPVARLTAEVAAGTVASD